MCDVFTFPLFGRTSGRPFASGELAKNGWWFTLLPLTIFKIVYCRICFDSPESAVLNPSSHLQVRSSLSSLYERRTGGQILFRHLHRSRHLRIFFTHSTRREALESIFAQTLPVRPIRCSLSCHMIPTDLSLSHSLTTRNAGPASTCWVTSFFESCFRARTLNASRCFCLNAAKCSHNSTINRLTLAV